MSSVVHRGAVVVSALLAVLAYAPAVAGAQDTDHQLLEKYQPVTQLDPTEQFRPASIQSFVADSRRTPRSRTPRSTPTRSPVSSPSQARARGG